MKKIVIALMGILVITGCKKEDKLICTIQEKEDTFTLNQNIEATFEQDEISKATFELNYQVKNQDLIKVLKQNSQESFSKYQNEEGVQIVEKEKENQYIYQINFDINKVDDNILDYFGLIGDNKLAIEDKLTIDGYTCKEG